MIKYKNHSLEPKKAIFIMFTQQDLNTYMEIKYKHIPYRTYLKSH